MTERIPVSVIGGYLGSGKTTLVNHILGQAASADGNGERTVVLVNDFGDINIDASLIRSRSEDTLELANGCICCSLIDGFASTLDKIIAMDPRPDRLVIEASGVSDPAAVAAFGHGPGLLLDAVIVVADAETVQARVEDTYVGQTVSQQLAAANVLVLNKSDLVSDVQLDKTLQWLTQRCPDAFVTAAEQGRVAPEVLFGRISVPPMVRHAHSAGETFLTSTIQRSEPMTREQVAALMDEMPDNVVRAKGFVWLEGSPDKPAVLQRVGKRWTLRRLGAWDTDPQTRIVVISVGP